VERLSEAEAAIDRTVEATREFTSGLEGTLEQKQEAVAEAMRKVGPPLWKTRRKLCHVLPCEGCGGHCEEMEDAAHDIVNARKGAPLHDPENLRRFLARANSIPLPEKGEAINSKSALAHAEPNMAFQIKGKSKEITRMILAGGVGGGVGFALVDKFGIQQIPGTTPNTKDAIHGAIGVVLTVVGAGLNKLWLGELGTGYLAVPIARLTERNALGGIPVGEIGISQLTAQQALPTGQIPGPITYTPGIVSDGRTGIVPTTVAGVKTF
jgi:hypothetical protein